MSRVPDWMEPTIRAGMSLACEAIAEAFDNALDEPGKFAQMVNDLAQHSQVIAAYEDDATTSVIIYDTLKQVVSHLQTESQRALNGEIAMNIHATGPNPFDVEMPDPFEVIAKLTERDD